MNYYLIAGERSGDLHGANLIRAIRRHDPAAHCRAWGGEQMEAAGADLVHHYREMAFMGFWEVVQNLGTIRRFLRECEADLLRQQPDVLILIDYAGFNLRMAKWAKKHGIRVFYYISPKVWAWNERRALTIKAVVDQMFVIFPFEVDFYKKYGYDVEYVGNPLLDALAAFTPDPAFRQNLGADKPIIAILPGSRRQEVTAILPTLLTVSRNFPDYQFVVGTVSNLPDALYDELLEDYPDVDRVADTAYDVLTISAAALVASGTATLETALLNVPQVVCYRTGRISYEIARRVIAVRFISLVNLIMDREIVAEVIQNALTAERVTAELHSILPTGSLRPIQLADYAELHRRMGEPGASERAGTRIVELMQEKSGTL